jgi:hypothetical protein
LDWNIFEINKLETVVFIQKWVNWWQLLDKVSKLGNPNRQALQVYPGLLADSYYNNSSSYYMLGVVMLMINDNG